MTSTDDDFLTSADALQVPWVHGPFFERQLESATGDAELRRCAREYAERGYTVLEGLVSDELVDQIVADYPRLFDPASNFPARWPRPTILTHDPNRVQDAWTVSAGVHRLACDPRVLDLLRFLYRREPIPFQTLDFLRGSQQPVHSDSIHFNSVPRDFMCGVWVALEDVTEENGPLVYLPGSHRLPDVGLDQLGLAPPDGVRADSPQYARFEAYVRAAIEVSGLEPQRLTVRKGTALVWSSRLLHGGSPILDPGSTRMSQVTHYYFEGCLYVAPILSNVDLGEFHLKTIHDIRTDEPVPHTLNGEPLEALAMPSGRVRFARPGSVTLHWTLSLLKQLAAARARRFLAKRGPAWHRRPR